MTTPTTTPHDPSTASSRGRPRSPPRGRPLPDQAGHRRPGPAGRAGDGVPAGPRPLPDRGRARPGQDAHRVDAWPHVIGGSFTRLQFTPDLVPADIVGTRIWRPSSEDFDIEWGPIFANIVLADEINRAPAKVQSALLEAMAERHVSIAGETRAAARRRSSCWPPRTRSSPRASTRCPRRSATASSCRSSSRTRPTRRRPRSPAAWASQPPTAEQVLTTEQLLALQDHGRRGLRPPRGARTTPCASSWPRATRQRWGLPDLAPHIALGASPRAHARPDRRRPRPRRAARPSLPACRRTSSTSRPRCCATG